jgi:hypothetical protein
VPNSVLHALATLPALGTTLSTQLRKDQ